MFYYELMRTNSVRIKSHLFMSGLQKVTAIHHICINLLVPSAQKINIENPGNQVIYWGGGGLNHPINFAGYLFFVHR